MDLLERGIRELGLYDEDRLEGLRIYIAELEFWNRRHNLVGAAGDDLIVRHILDSLAGTAVLKELIGSLPESGSALRIADIGSGAGLPGIPLAIWLKECSFTLVEKISKRCGFLRNVLPLCGLRNCRVLCSQIEQTKEIFDICVFRALGKFAEYLQKLEGVTPAGGFAVAYKGKRATIDEELKNPGPRWNFEKIYPVTVPFLKEERNLVVLSRQAL